MLEQAIAKIKAEMESDKTNGNMQGAGELLIEYLQGHPDAASAVMKDGVTLKKAYQALHDEARRRAAGKSSCYMRDADGLGIILEYFGIKAAGGTAEQEKPGAGSFDVNLDALLGL